MSVQDLNRVHRRYITLSNTFKSAWTFHQFVQGLKKAFPDVETGSYPSNFQVIYGDLKMVSENLSETTAEDADQQLGRVEDQLGPLIDALLVADRKISPSRLRRFFQRIKNYDDNILTHLIKFYLYTRGDDAWDLDRLDKADFLVTKLAEEYEEARDRYTLRDRTSLREMAESFWSALGGDQMPQQEADELCARLKSFEQAITAVDAIDELHRQDLIPRFRDFKHQLGDAYFQPRVLYHVLETNLALKNHVHRLYRRDEQRIVAEYQQVFELERDVPIDIQLSEELTDFRQAVERYEHQLEGENVRLADVAGLRQKVRDLMPKLKPSNGEASISVDDPSEAETGEWQADWDAAASPEDEYVEELYRRIVAVLDDTNAALEAKKVALQPEVFALGLTGREITAYRRLYGDSHCDREVERFVLRAAAMRARVESEVDEIKDVIDDASIGMDAAIYRQARITVRFADLFLKRFDHHLGQAVQGGDVAEAQALQSLKIRMMRGYSGLWLMVHQT